MCRLCRDRIRYIEEPRCLKCSKTLDDEDALICSDCQKITHRFERGFGLYDYKTISQALYRYKYEGRREYAEFFGDEIVCRLGHEIELIKPDGIVPVPLSEERFLTRGYNQAELVARVVGERLGIPVYDDLAARVKSTKVMKKLGPEERKNNLKGAFKLCRNDVKLETIIIMDDIYTTGSTIDAVCGALMQGFVRKCYFLTLTIGKGI